MFKQHVPIVHFLRARPSASSYSTTNSGMSDTQKVQIVLLQVLVLSFIKRNADVFSTNMLSRYISQPNNTASKLTVVRPDSL